MPNNEQFYQSSLTRPGDLVKAKIIALGVRIGDLATEAGVSKSQLTFVIQGKTVNRALRYKIFVALRELTGVRKISQQWLWGKEAA